MTIQELFIRSNEELKKVVNQITERQWDLDVPAGMTRNPAKLRQTINYHAYDDAWVPDVLAGKTKEQVGEVFEPLLSSTDTLANYNKYNTVAIDAVRDFKNLEMTTHLSYGDFPARDYLQHIISFRGFRCYDIAKMIGIDTKMADDLVQALWDEFSPVAETYQRMGVFPKSIEVSDSADLQTKLLALVGRQ